MKKPFGVKARLGYPAWQPRGQKRKKETRRLYYGTGVCPGCGRIRPLAPAGSSGRLMLYPHDTPKGFACSYGGNSLLFSVPMRAGQYHAVVGRDKRGRRHRVKQ